MNYQFPKIEVTITLDGGNARRKICAWRAFQYQSAKRLSSLDFDISNLLHSPAKWIELNPILDAAGNAVPPTPRLPQRPGPLAANAHAAVTTMYLNAMRIADTAAINAETFKQLMMDSCGEDIKLEIEDRIMGYLDIPHWEIFEYVSTNYGTLNADDITWFTEDLKTWNLEKPFATNIARMKQTFAELASLHMYTAEIEKIAILTEATRPVASVSGIIELYYREYPLIADQNFQALANFIILHLPHATAQVRAHAAEANAVVAAAAAQNKKISDLEARLAAFETAANATERARIAGAGQKASPGGKPKNRSYCFEHGFVTSHNGIGCRVLKSRYPNDPRFKNAKLPCTIDGIEGSRNYE